MDAYSTDLEIRRSLRLLLKSILDAVYFSIYALAVIFLVIMVLCIPVAFVYLITRFVGMPGC